jgi:NADH-quinone oxidoreductase subunit G
MFGAAFKAYAERNADDRQLVIVSVMPCTAKKGEAIRSEFARDGSREVDYVITSQELANMIRQAGIRFDELQPGAPDVPFGTYSGAGLIFGVTGGVTEAVMREMIRDKSFDSFENIKFSGVRGFAGVKETELLTEDSALKIAVVSGLKNADDLIAGIKSGEARYDFVEVMACPGGCINGAGQPFYHGWDKKERARGLYEIDGQTAIRHPDANPFTKLIYEQVIGDRAHELLHVRYGAR